MTKKVHWQDGALLSAKSFLTQDNLIHDYINSSTSLPFQMSYGIISLDFDSKLLSLGEIKIIECFLYTKDRTFIEIKKNQHNLNLLLTEEKTAIVSVYLNAIEKSIVKDIPVLEFEYFLSNNYESSATHSIKLCEAKLSGDSWELCKYSPALLTCKSITFEPILTELEKIIISSQHLAKHYQHQVGLYNALVSCIFETDFLVKSIKKSPIHYHPFLLFLNIAKLRNLLLSVSEGNNDDFFEYNFYSPHDSFSALFKSISYILHKPVKQQIIEFTLDEKSFIISNLSQSFLASKQFFLVIKKPSIDSPDPDLNDIKISSISRNKHINQMSLSGIKLDFLPESGIHQLNNPLLYKTYSIMPGLEWDHILSEKNMMFESTAQNIDYQFMIYYR